MPPEEKAPRALTRDELLTMDKAELVDCVLMAVEAQSLFTSNLSRLVDLLAAKTAEVDQLKATITNQEAELTVLRNEP